MFAVMYMSADVVALRFLTTPRVVGEYALIPQILQATQIIPFAITLAAFPALVANNERGGEHLLRHGAGIARTLVLLGSFCGLALILVVPPILPLAFGEEYTVTGSLLRVAALSLPFLFLRQLTTKMFICVERGKLLAGIEAAGFASAVLLNVLLIPRYGAFGAAASTVISYALTTLLAFGALGLLGPVVGHIGRRNV
jgi:O-antigen/teichoic acid export membrane protein